MQATQKTLSIEAQIPEFIGEGKVSNRELSDYFGVPQSSMAHILRRMMRKNIIAKVSDGYHCAYKIKKVININRIKLTNRQGWRVA